MIGLGTDWTCLQINNGLMWSGRIGCLDPVGHGRLYINRLHLVPLQSTQPLLATLRLMQDVDRYCSTDLRLRGHNHFSLEQLKCNAR